MRLASLALLCSAPALFAQFSAGSLEANLKALHCHTVLIAPKEKVVDPIHWSPDSKAIGIKLDGAWVRCDLDRLQLKRFKWRNNQDVAAPLSRPSFEPLPDELRKTWPAGSEEESRVVKTWTGIEVALVLEPPKTVAMMVKLPDRPNLEVWSTTQEDCQALSLSPDQRWVAFLCGIHGVAVMRLPDLKGEPRITRPVPAVKGPMAPAKPSN